MVINLVNENDKLYFTFLDSFSELKLLKLVGPFTLLDDLHKGSSLDSDYLVQHRFSTDLPEMETIMIYQGGRFCYWRDAPKEHPKYLIHVSNEPKNFPAFDIVGHCDPFACIAFLLQNNQNIAKDVQHLLPKSFVLEKYGRRTLQTLKAERNKNSVFTGFGKFFLISFSWENRFMEWALKLK